MCQYNETFAVLLGRIIVIGSVRVWWLVCVCMTVSVIVFVVIAVFVFDDWCVCVYDSVRHCIRRHCSVRVWWLVCVCVWQCPSLYSSSLQCLCLMTGMCVCMTVSVIVFVVIAVFVFDDWCVCVWQCPSLYSSSLQCSCLMTGVFVYDSVRHCIRRHCSSRCVRNSLLHCQSVDIWLWRRPRFPRVTCCWCDLFLEFKQLQHCGRWLGMLNYFDSKLVKMTIDFASK